MEIFITILALVGGMLNGMGASADASYPTEVPQHTQVQSSGIVDAGAGLTAYAG